MDKYIIGRDTYNWILIREYTLGDTSKYAGEVRQEAISFHPTLEHLRRAVVERSLKAHGLEELEQAKAELMALTLRSAADARINP